MRFANLTMYSNVDTIQPISLNYLKQFKPLIMSRKITKEAVSAFLERRPFSKSNMKVVEDYGIYRLKLHNNTIAIIDELGVLSVSNAGWASNTTKERLNGLPNVSVYQKNWNWYLNGKEWTGEWTRIGIVQ
jgi:hypothetical protein